MTMPTRLSTIGDLERPDHHYLPIDAICYFWGEYTPYEYTDGEKWNFSPTNQLIANFKKSVDRKGRSEWNHKIRAIEEVSQQFARFWKWEDLVEEHRVALIPVPPSKARDDALYDSRMADLLERIATHCGYQLDIRDCLTFSGINAASHNAVARPTPDELYAQLQFDDAIGKPGSAPGVIFVFDDMLTTGAHYVAVSRKLSEAFPGVPIVGNFIARRTIPNPFGEIDILI